MPERWIANKLFPTLPRDVRRRKTRLLLVGISLAMLMALIIGGALYALNATGRLGN